MFVNFGTEHLFDKILFEEDPFVELSFFRLGLYYVVLNCKVEYILVFLIECAKSVKFIRIIN